MGRWDGKGGMSGNWVGSVDVGGVVVVVIGAMVVVVVVEVVVMVVLVLVWNVCWVLEFAWGWRAGKDSCVRAIVIYGWLSWCFCGGVGKLGKLDRGYAE